MRKLKLLLLSALFVLTPILGSANHFGKIDRNKKNAIKGMVFPIGFVGTYERFISNKSSLTGLFGIAIDFESESGEYVRASELSYKYYFTRRNNYIKNLWGSTGLGYMRVLAMNNNSFNDFFLGYSVSFGKDFYFSKKESWVLSVGFGITVMEYFELDYARCRKDISEPFVLPRAILMIGRRF